MESTERDELRAKALHQVARLFCVIESRHLPRGLAVDLSMAQIKACFALEQRGPLVVGGVADCLHIGQPAASILVDRLVHLGMVPRSEDPDDRRRTVVELTVEGQEMVSRARGHRLALLESWLADVPAEGLRALTEGLAALSTAAEQDSAESPHAIPAAH